MNSVVESEARPRPLSGGLWTLFSWLRHGSSSSVSSSGSDRSAASFAFLSPARYAAAAPRARPPPGPPTDSYKKRVRDRNLRRQHDRDLTLHRKYGLYKSEGPTNYDAFSLPPARIRSESGDRWDRERRATSECLQRRLAHVPGKRRAPQPPAPAASLARRSRKRPAPQPPINSLVKNKENTKSADVESQFKRIESNSYREKIVFNNDLTMECKPEKFIKKEVNTKDTKSKSEKSFIKQIFDSKKRSSIIDTTSVKVLPSISELDKQAAEIIKNSKALEQKNYIKKSAGSNIEARKSNQGDTWFCVSCLRKYDSSVITCLHCVPNNNIKDSERPNILRDTKSKASSSFTQTEKEILNHGSNNKNIGNEDKQKLKEMLKDLKDSLPKRPKHELSNKAESKIIVASKISDKTAYCVDTPTLRVGYNDQNAKKKTLTDAQTSSSDFKIKSTTNSHHPEPVAFATPSISPNKTILLQKSIMEKYNIPNIKNIHDVPKTNKEDAKTEIKKQPQVKYTYENKKDLQTPLKISSLLNPAYIPKSSVGDKSQAKKLPDLDPIKLENSKAKTGIQTSYVPFESTHILPAPSTSQTRLLPVTHKTENIQQIEKLKSADEKSISLTLDDKPTFLIGSKDKNVATVMPAKETNVVKCMNVQDQHSKRRNLINQLEQSIAKGDEKAAAEAAVKLAQLRLSCSVLSYSSQILSQPSTSAVAFENGRIETNNVTTPHINEAMREVIKKSEKTPQRKENNNSSQLEIDKPKSTSTIASTTSTSSILVPKQLFIPKIKDIANKQKIQETEKEIQKETPNDNVTIAVMVEDREATRGPVKLSIRRQALVRDLRREAETSLGLATHLQRWIIGRALCADDATPVAKLAGTDFSAPFYLCVVESDPVANGTKINEASNKDEKASPKGCRNVYTELMQLEQQALVPNAENFECGVCMEKYEPGMGVVLRECVHIFCKDCLSDVVRHCEEPDISCPAMGCRGMLHEREIRALVSPQDYERWLARGLAAAESGTRNSFHCRTKDCKGWALCDPGVRRFPCPVCKKINCVPCQTIHDSETCEQHRAKLNQKASTSTTEPDDGTKTLLAALISKGEALECPECSAIITKKWGCDWVKCSACKTEICWVTRGRRWGPAGKGDTSAGCRCGVDGKRCHPSCGYCH